MTSAVNTQAGTEAPNTNPQVIDVAVENLEVPDSHPRQYKGDMESLKESIRCNDLLEPLTVCKSEDSDKYMVIDGTRRLTVLAELKKTSVPCVVLESMPLGQIAHVAYVKNAERENLSVIEIAMHLKAMKDKYKFSLRELKMKGYGSAATIGNQIKLLKLSKEIQSSLHEGKLTMAHGLALLKLDSKEEQKNWAEQIEKERLSAAKADKMITDFIEKGNHPKPDPVAISPVVPGVYIKDSRDMIEVADESVHLIVTGAPQLISESLGFFFKTLGQHPIRHGRVRPDSRSRRCNRHQHHRHLDPQPK
jgi:ParB family chromosome partitioning protein